MKRLLLAVASTLAAGAVTALLVGDAGTSSARAASSTNGLSANVVPTNRRPLPVAAAVRGGPVTLVLAKGPITAFAQDGGRIAWASTEWSNKRCPYVVRIRTLATGRQSPLDTPGARTCWTGRLDRGRLCDPAGCPAPKLLALAGGRALWVLTSCGNICDNWFMSGSLVTGRDELVNYLGSNSFSPYNGVRGVVGDGKTLAYAWLDSDDLEPPNCDPSVSCPVVITGYRVDRLAAGSRSAVPVAGAPPPAALAIAGDDVAVLSRGKLGESPKDQPSEIEVRKLYGTLVDRFDVGAPVSAIAFSAPDLVAVLVTRSTGKSIELYATGRLVGSVPVPTGTTPKLSISGSRVVFSVGRSIRLLELGESVRELAVTPVRPVGLSIEGRRVAWAEDVRVHDRLLGRIRALVLARKSGTPLAQVVSRRPARVRSLAPPLARAAMSCARRITLVLRP
jgi:hypothetical protein